MPNVKKENKELSIEKEVEVENIIMDSEPVMMFPVVQPERIVTPVPEYAFPDDPEKDERELKKIPLDELVDKLQNLIIYAKKIKNYKVESELHNIYNQIIPAFIRLCNVSQETVDFIKGHV